MNQKPNTKPADRLAAIEGRLDEITRRLEGLEEQIESSIADQERGGHTIPLRPCQDKDLKGRSIEKDRCYKVRVTKWKNVDPAGKVTVEFVGVNGGSLSGKDLKGLADETKCFCGIKDVKLHLDAKRGTAKVRVERCVKEDWDCPSQGRTLEECDPIP